MLLGGHDGDLVFGDLWERRGGRWILLDSVPRVHREPNNH
jgi:hypothetical protein